MASDASLLRAGEARRQLIEQLRENSTRPARCRISMETRGVGNLVLPTPVAFDVTFVEEPIPGCGLALAPGQRIKRNVFPVVTLGIYDWVRNDKGFFTGARIFAHVELSGGNASGDILAVSEEGGYVLHHYLTLEGIAMKTMPTNLLTGLTTGQDVSGASA